METVSSLNWDQIVEEATQILCEYVRIDTTNPPGNELAGAEYLRGICKKEGLEVEIFPSANNRANLLARLKGDGTKKPIILLSHIDVVGAEKEEWSVEPFAGIVKDGSIWGRGTVDCKGLGVMELMSMILLKKNQIKLKRDVILLAVADEETGGEVGAGWMIRNHPDKLRAEFVLNEGGVGMKGGVAGRDSFAPCFGEKGPCWIKVAAEGMPGHGSMPSKDNANDILINALGRLQRYQFPLMGKWVKEALLYFARRASIFRSFLLRMLASPLLSVFLFLLKGVVTKNKRFNAMLRNTVALTNLKAGFKENVIPSRSEAVLDCRLIPGTSTPRFISDLQKIINDQRIKIEVIKNYDASQSPLDTEFFEVIEKTIRKNSPQAMVMPILAPGFTDSRWLREQGLIAYGLIPCLLSSEEVDSIHGRDEKISLESFKLGLKNVYEICLEICTR
ncbi:MAG: M20/M25/M40 family metallo-hydrolase [Deltaproteobacteria bacterium]|nr:MAG: M20/M25/M40 family metallo-hydrolase [Deltaproteobacteria bacterium]